MKIRDENEDCVYVEISSREAAELIVALTLHSMAMTAGGIFMGSKPGEGHRLVTNKQMREELSELLKRRKERYGEQDRVQSGENGE